MSKPCVLVTGASTGIGKACALALAKQGFHVYAGVRKSSDGDSLRAEGGDNIEPLILDVTKPEDISAVQALLKSRIGARGLDGIVNNAGIAVAGPFEFLPIDEWRRQFEINVFGQIMVTQALLSLVRTAKGRICFIGSTSGFFSAPFTSPYGASKFCIEAFADALRVELAPWRIQVSVVQPGAIQTPIWEKSKGEADAMIARMPPEAHALYGPAIGAIKAQVEKTVNYAVPADQVAKAVLHALTATRPRTRYRVGMDAFIQYLLARLVPDRLRDTLVRKMLGV